MNMRIPILLRWLATLAFYLASQLVAYASHILGGDIAYSPITSTAGVPRYHITVRLYRDPTGAQQPDVTLMGSRNGCGSLLPGNFVRQILRSKLLPATSPGCRGWGHSYEVLLYETDEDLPPGQWTLSVYAENRIAGIINMVRSEAQTFFISSFLDNATVRENSSPKFLSTLLPYLCGNSVQHCSFSTFDSEGDSLNYHLVPPQSGVLPYGQCGADIAGDLAPYFQLDNTTGALSTSGTATRAGRYAMAVRVDEYRRVGGTWRLIGGVTRDVSYIAYASANNSPRFTGCVVDSAATTQPVAQLIRVRPGQTISLLLSAADADATQALTFSSQAPDVIPGLRFTTVSANQARLTWQVPTNLPTGRYTATVAVVDDACPLHATAEQTLSFLVISQPLATRPATEAELTAFPTPFRDQVQFKAPSGGLILIVDQLGRTITQLRAGIDGRVQWQPAASLPAGLYLARGTDGRPLARLLRADN